MTLALPESFTTIKQTLLAQGAIHIISCTGESGQGGLLKSLL